MSIGRNSGKDKGFLITALPISISRKGYIQKNNLPSKASVNMKGLVEEGNNGEMEKLDSCLNPPPFQIALMVSCTVNWEMMEGGGPALACRFPPPTPLPAFSSGFLLILLVRWAPVSSEGWSVGPCDSGCHGVFFSPPSFDTLAISLHNPLTGGCPYSKEKKS